MKTRAIALSDRNLPSKIGGPALLGASQPWPLDRSTGTKLTFLFQLDRTFLEEAGADVVLPEDMIVSVFMLLRPGPHGGLESVAEMASVPQQSDLKEDLSSLVLVHARGTARHESPNGLPNMKSAGLVLSSEQDDVVQDWAPDRSALTTSKVGGFPSWCQDPISVPGQSFVMQLNNRACDMAGPARYGNIFFGGIGYLFLPRLLVPGECGRFFFQFT